MLTRDELQGKSWIIPSTDIQFHYQEDGVILCGEHGTLYPICEDMNPSDEYKCSHCNGLLESRKIRNEYVDNWDQTYEKYLVRIEKAKTREEKKAVIADIIDDWY